MHIQSFILPISAIHVLMGPLPLHIVFTLMWDWGGANRLWCGHLLHPKDASNSNWRILTESDRHTLCLRHNNPTAETFLWCGYKLHPPAMPSISLLGKTPHQLNNVTVEWELNLQSIFIPAVMHWLNRQAWQTCFRFSAFRPIEHVLP